MDPQEDQAVETQDQAQIIWDTTPLQLEAQDQGLCLAYLREMATATMQTIIQHVNGMVVTAVRQLQASDMSERPTARR